MSALGDLSTRGARRQATRAHSSWPSWRRLFLLWLPGVVVTSVVLLPVVYLALRALEGGPRTLELLLRARTAQILGNTVALAVSVTAASALVGTALAWLTARTDLPWRRGWSVLTALPLVIPSYVGAYLFGAAFGPRGMLQGALETALGVDRLPSIYGFPGASLVLTLLSYPYVLLPVRAALRRLDPALEESARSLGQNPKGTFIRVILPQLRPAIAAGSLLVALYALRDFGAVAIMRFTTFTRAIYVQYQSAFDRSTAAGLSLVLIPLTLGLLILDLRNRRNAGGTAGENPRVAAPAMIPLGRWRLPALLFCGILVLLGLGLPAIVLGFWLIRGLRAGAELGSLVGAMGNSLLASSLAAAATVVAALPIAVLATRYPRRLSRALERLSHVGFALPGIVIALALVFFGIRGAPALYQTLPMLILAYVVLFLPQAAGSLSSSLLQVPRRLEEAGRSLGRSPLAVFREVTLPLVRPGVLAGAGLVFLTTMKELQATLLLSPFGFDTLATEVWSAVSEAFFAKAAAPALLLILTSSLPMAYFVLRDDGNL